MKFGMAILVIVSLAGCSRESVPIIPSIPIPIIPTAPAGAGSALLWVMVIENESCIEGATIQIVRAEGASEPMPQKTPCDVWDYDSSRGLLLRDLTADERVTLRGAAPGYAPREMSFQPFPMPGSFRISFIELSKTH
jgi:hypothetical protein